MTIYIGAPAHGYTGGPTALHQLCREIRRHGVEAFMAYFNIEKDRDPVHPEYKRYNCPWIPIERIRDNKDDIIVVPETMTTILNRFHKIKRVIYWLSVDNYILSTSKLKKKDIIKFLIKHYLSDINFIPIREYRKYYGNSYMAYYVMNIINNKSFSIPYADLHIAQSKYAMEFLKYSGINKDKMLIVYEPLEVEFLTWSKSYEKQDIITWNSRKAFPITFKLIKLLTKKQKNKIKIIELYNIGKDRILKLWSLSKLFIDIGIHPGRDRPPREAAILDNLVITNNHGGCFYDDDCPLPREFKIDCYLDINCKLNLEKYIDNILNYLENYDYYIKMFSTFKEKIILESRNYSDEVKVFLKKIGI